MLFFLCVHIILYIWPLDRNWPEGKYLVLHVVLSDKCVHAFGCRLKL